jgi:hypothetical protein
MRPGKVVRNLIVAPISVIGWLIFFAGVGIILFGLLSMGGVIGRFEAMDSVGAALIASPQKQIEENIILMGAGCVVTVFGYLLASKASVLKRVGLR